MNAVQRQWRAALAVYFGLMVGSATAKVTIDEAAKEAMAQQLMGKVSGLREMQDGLALAQADIDMLQRKLRVMKQQAELVGSSQLDDLIRRAEAELNNKVARTAAIAEKAGTGEMQPYYQYAIDVLRDAEPLMEGFADRVGEFSPKQQAEKALSLRGAEAAVMSAKREFYANMTSVHKTMADAIGKSLGTDAPISTYFDGYLTYAKEKGFVTEDQRDELWHMISWFMLDYLSEDPPAGQRTILDTMCRMRRNHDESYEQMMKYIPDEYRASESELGRPHSDWLVVIREAKSDVQELSKFAFILLQVGMWQTTLLLGNKAVATQKDMELDGVLSETRTKLKEMGVEQTRVDAAQTADEVIELAVDRVGSAKAGESTAELAQLAVRIRQVAAEFQQATSHATSSEREVKEAAIPGESSGTTRSVSAAVTTSSSSAGDDMEAGDSDDYDDFPDEDDREEKVGEESGSGIGKKLLYVAVAAGGAYLMYKGVKSNKFQTAKGNASGKKRTFMNALDVVVGKGGDFIKDKAQKTSVPGLKTLRAGASRIPFFGRFVPSG
ncbi:MAG: hypothetical protein PVJ92_00870 [Candidatus Dependentiae bacterium]